MCAVLLSQKGKTRSYSEIISKINLLQQTQTEIYNFSDIQDVQDSNDWEKVKFDSLLAQPWLHYFFAGYTYNTQVAAVQNGDYITAPRYILYHCLQIAGC
ncbi:hypothetical protein [Chryseobacterium candidae]|uniref:Uncharacterized protein n=1 Tax=Chryseobacterium candidae TaxID=1978493 RepID=A0ABY2R737_9FLAO|nr:hypothetical protein [Chryseobacterium candidae]THV59889.1 hypothetical protein EK417_10590 [Chryseobacterium candidae]